MPDYSDPELSAQQAGILRRQRIAEMIRARSMQPLESQQIPNGYVVPTNPLLGIGKVLEAYLGKRAGQKTEEEQIALAQKAQGLESAERQKVADALMPTPAIPEPSAELGGGPGRPMMEKTPEEKRLAIVDAVTNSRFPSTQKYGELQQKFVESDIAREDTQKAREDAAKIAAETALEKQRMHDETISAMTSNKINSAEKIASDKLAAKDVATQAKLTAKLPQAKLAKDLVINNNDNLKNALIELRDHPGLEGITGSIYGRVPSVADESTAAQAKLDTIKNQIFVSTLQAMRASSKTGGAVGNVSDKEGERLENSMAALSRVQPTDDFKAEINKIISRLETTSGLMNNAFEEEYGGIQPAAEPTLPTISTPKRIKFDAQGNQVQ